MKLIEIKIYWVILAFLFLCPVIQAEWIVYNQENGNLISDFVTSIEANDSGSVWIGENSHGLVKYHEFYAWLYYSASQGGLINDYITDIAKAPSGKMWFSTLGGLSNFDGDSTWHSYNKDSGLPHVDIAAFDIDDSGELWLGTFGAGLTHFDGDSTYIHYTVDSGLIDDRILSVIAESSGDIWIGTYSGVSKFDRVSQWSNFTSDNSELLDDTVRAIAEDGDENIWFGSSIGLSKLSPDSTWTVYFENNNCPYNIEGITALAIDSLGHLWIGHNARGASGVLVTEFDRISDWAQYDLENNPVTQYVAVSDITVDTAGNIWVATSGEGVTLIEFEPTSAPEETTSLVPADYSLSQNRPNPFNQTTTIQFSLPRKARVTISVFNLLGQKIKDLIDDVRPAGSFETIWDGTDSSGKPAASGIYFYQLKTENFTDTKKLVLLK